MIWRLRPTSAPESADELYQDPYVPTKELPDTSRTRSRRTRSWSG